MTLKKWVFGTRLSTQITEQNANITEIDAKLNNLGDFQTKFTQITPGQKANININSNRTSMLIAVRVSQVGNHALYLATGYGDLAMRKDITAIVPSTLVTAEKTDSGFSFTSENFTLYITTITLSGVAPTIVIS